MIGDNAYVCSEHLLTPFSGDQQNNPRKDAYNFYLSQLRIRIEMAFGLLTSKWRILRRPLQCKLKHAGKLFLCVARLHNFCINERLLHGQQFQVGGGATGPASFDDDDNDVTNDTDYEPNEGGKKHNRKSRRARKKPYSLKKRVR